MDQACPKHISNCSLNHWLSLPAVCVQHTAPHHLPTTHLKMSCPVAEVSISTGEGMKAGKMRIMQQVCFDKITSFPKTTGYLSGD